MLSPLLLTYFAYHAVRWTVRGEGSVFPFVLVLATAFLLRRHVFLLEVTVLVLMVALRLIPWRAFVPRATARRGVLAALVIAPALLWSGIAWAQYGSPLFPHDTRVSASVFDPAVQGNETPEATREADDRGFVDRRVDRLERLATDSVDGHNFLLEHYLPVFPEAENVPKHLFAGVSLSVFVTLGLIGFVLLAGRLSGIAGARRLRLLAVAYVAGSALVVVEFIATYPKFHHYLAFLIALFPALLVVELGRRWPRVPVATGVALLVLGTGVGFWAINSWGHAARDSSLTNAKLLVPGYGTPFDRLARETGRTPGELRLEIDEYSRAVDSGGNVLYMDHEPGALVPAIADRDFLGRVLYLENARAAPIRDARNRGELRAAFERLGIDYVYRPGRAHVTDGLLVMRLVRGHPSPPQSVIPVGEL